MFREGESFEKRITLKKVTKLIKKFYKEKPETHKKSQKVKVFRILLRSIYPSEILCIQYIN